MTGNTEGENQISLSTNGRNAVRDAKQILNGFDLGGRTVTGVDVVVNYADDPVGDDEDDSEETPYGVRPGSDLPGRVKPGTKEGEVLRAIGEYEAEHGPWWLNSDIEDVLDFTATASSFTSRLDNRKHLLDKRRPGQLGPKYEYRLNVAGQHEYERLFGGDDGED